MEGAGLTDAQHERAVTLLEGKRLAYDAAMWNLPALTLVVQAFLLGVLTSGKVRLTIAVAITVAGVFMLAVVALALWQLHDREHHFAERVKGHAIALGLGDPNRTTDRHRRHPLEWKGWRWWSVPFVAFAIADLLALVLTHRG